MGHDSEHAVYFFNKSVVHLKMRVVSDDDTSSNDDTSKDSIDDISENFSEALINYLSARDPQWQFPKHTQEEQPKPLYVLIKTEEEEPLPLDIVYPH
ncbi:hypothetical protein Tco_1225750 [Tanacetum coccineum]